MGVMSPKPTVSMITMEKYNELTYFSKMER
jgi:hypothetical protein